MTILVGSTRAAKVEGVRDAVADIARRDPRFAAANIQGRDMTTIAPRMPMTTTEILEGARRRAQALLDRREAAPDAVTYAVGVEGGVDRLGSGRELTLQTWAAVTDGAQWGFGGGPILVLPAAIARRVADGEELGDVIDELARGQIRGTRGAWGLLTSDLIDRRAAFRLAVTAAFARFYNPAAW